jgi:hypothetical protein
LQENQEKKETQGSRQRVSSTSRVPLYAFLDSWFDHHQANYDPDRSDGGQWETPLWAATYTLKGQPAYRRMARPEIVYLFEQWLASRNIEWDNISGIESESEGRAELVGCWRAIRFGEGCAPLDAALDMAQQVPLRFRSQDFPDDDRTYQLFLGVAFHLQKLTGERNILLPCRLLAAKLRVSAMTISRYRGSALSDGYLREDKPSYFSSNASRATEFRFNVTHPGISDQFGKPINA